MTPAQVLPMCNRPVFCLQQQSCLGSPARPEPVWIRDRPAVWRPRTLHMLRTLTLLTYLLAASAGTAATYCISPTGNDNNSGTQAHPWATYPQAVRTVQAGDTVLVQPGIYPLLGNDNNSGTCFFTVSGNSNALITFHALGPVTNQLPFCVVAPYYCFDGFVWDGVSGIFVGNARRGSTPGPGGHHVIVTNCTVQNAMGFPASAFGMDVPLSSPANVPGSAPSYNTFI